MTIQRLLRFTGLLMVLGAVMPLHAAGDVAAGKEKSQTCAACHGPDGNSTNTIWPVLAGQSIEYISKQLHDFQSGARKNAQMTPMAAPLSAQDIENLAAYFNSQKPKFGTAAKDSVDPGQDLYRAGDAETGVPACMACHSPDGAGNPAAVFPALHGQHADYTMAQLKAFRSGDRSNDPNAVMRTIAGRMSDDQIKAVAQYIQGLH